MSQQEFHETLVSKKALSNAGDFLEKRKNPDRFRQVQTSSNVKIREITVRSYNTGIRLMLQKINTHLISSCKNALTILLTK